MNAKNIILAILMVLSFAACSSEIEGIDDTMPNTSANNANGTTSISVRMTTGDMTTKSASEPEKEIYNYIIAVFEHGSKERVGYVKGQNSSTGSLNVDTKEGLVDIYVVANLNQTDEAKFDAIYTSTEFVAQTVGSPSNLVKVGSLIGQEITATNISVSVDLLQLAARIQVNVKKLASVNGDASGKGDITAKIEVVSYKAKVENTSKLIAPVAGTGVMPKAATVLDVNNFHFDTYKLNNPEMELSVEITVSAKGKEDTTINKTISVPFQKDGSSLSVLENGKFYELNIDAAVSVSVGCEVRLNYTLHDITDIKQDIVFN